MSKKDYYEYGAEYFKDHPMSNIPIKSFHHNVSSSHDHHHHHNKKQKINI